MKNERPTPVRIGQLLAILLVVCGLGLRAQNSVQVYWSGALSATGITVKARLNAATDSVRLLYCAPPCLNGASFSAYATADSINDLVATFTIDGLEADREHIYRFEVDGVLDTTAAMLGKFRTAPVAPGHYSFLFGSCNSISYHPAWSAMREKQPLFFLSTGDLHYRDPNSLDLEQHRVPYREDVLSYSPMKEFLHEVPIAFVWDDHDFCGNGSDGSFIGKYNAARAYREYVPHYPLPDPVGVYQAFTIGRVHFILSDLRSSKAPESMMDIEQFAWLLQQFTYARNNGLLAAWVTPLTWNSVGYPENWACQPTERTALNDFLFDQDVKDMFILSGDAHMLAIDDGTNADFSTAQSGQYSYPIFQAAAIARHGSYKGGVFNQGGYFPNPDLAHGQFGEVIVDDDGDQVCITMKGWRTDSLSTNVSLINSYVFCRTLPDPDAGVDEVRNGNLLAWYNGGQLFVEQPFNNGSMTVTVFDALGRSVLRTEQRSTDGRHTVPLHALGAGVHAAMITSGSSATLIRFVHY